MKIAKIENFKVGQKYKFYTDPVHRTMYRIAECLEIVEANDGYNDFKAVFKVENKICECGVISSITPLPTEIANKYGALVADRYFALVGKIKVIHSYDII